MVSSGGTSVTDFQNLSGTMFRRTKRLIMGLYLSETPGLLAPYGCGNVCLALLM